MERCAPQPCSPRPGPAGRAARLVRRGAVKLRRRPEPRADPCGPQRFGARRDNRSRATAAAAPWAVVGCLCGVAAAGPGRVAAALAGHAEGRGPGTGPRPGDRARSSGCRSVSAEALPAGTTVASYHSGLGRDRAAVYEAARGELVDVVIGTRAAALLPCQAWVPSASWTNRTSAHRAPPGLEGLPLHAGETWRNAARPGRRRSCFSHLPRPCEAYAEELGPKRTVRELPSRAGDSWPIVRIVDMRGSGAALSSTLLDACRARRGVGQACRDRGQIVAATRRPSAAPAAGPFAPAATATCRSPSHGEDGPLVCTALRLTGETRAVRDVRVRARAAAGTRVRPGAGGALGRPRRRRLAS